MSLKMMKSRFLVSAFVAMSSVVVVGCGGSSDDDEKDSGGGGRGSDAGGGGGGEDAGRAAYNFPDPMTLITVLAQDSSGFVAESHDVELLNAADGKALSPPFKTTTKEGAGSFTFKNIPGDTDVWIHVIGKGPKSDVKSTYDSLSLGAPDSGENVIRISQVGTASTAEMTGNFTGKQDHVAIGGAVYRVDASGKRVGSIGCARVYVDDEPHPSATTDQRYIAANGLPTTIDKLDETLRSGKFYFGNITKGKHTFKVSVDEGKTFIATLEVFVPLTRDDASGEFKSVLVLMGIDVPGADPTPASCPK